LPLEIDDLSQVGSRPQAYVLPVPAFSDALKPQQAFERLTGLLRGEAVEHGPAKALDGLVRRYAAEGPGALRPFLPGHQLELQPIAVGKAQERLAEALGPFNGNAELL